MADRWEYKVVYFAANQWTSTGLNPEINEQCDAYGASGWELVSTTPITRWSFYGSTTVGIVAFFKRPGTA